MIDKGAIIEESLLAIGETTIYNDNTSDMYKIADSLLKAIINNLSYDNSFLFNAVEFKLTKSGIKDNYFNMPSDFLNLVASTQKIMISGEYFVCDSDDVTILYCKRMSASDLPAYISEYVKTILCYKLCLTNTSYNDKIEYFQSLMRMEADNLINSQYYDIEKWIPID